MTDIQLFRPQRLTDNPDGGGLATATPIVDGEANNLFDDISRIDRVNGELSLRKVFAIAPTEDTELFSDLHMVVKQPPLDPRVSAVLFRATAWDDQREAAKNYVERYVDESVITRMIPYDRQLAGARAVIVYQRKDLPLPEIGEVYALKAVDGTVEFFAIQAVDHEVQTFGDPGGGDGLYEYDARVVTLTITQPLSRDFEGSQPNRYFRADSMSAVVRKTVTSDAARYKGTVRLAQDAAVGDIRVKVESVFSQLVPAALSEIPVSDIAPEGTTAYVAAASARQVLTLIASNQPTIYATTPIMPGTVEITTDVSGRRYIDRDGALLDATAGNAVVGTVDYPTGRCHTDLATGFGNANVTTLRWMPAARIDAAPLSVGIPVSANNRGYIYLATLRPPPAPGVTTLSYMAQGKRYTLQDDGTGALRGESGVGVGQVNFQTGALQATLGALPDIGSMVVVSYGGTSEFEIRDSDPAVTVPAVEFVLEQGNCEPGTLNLQWTAGGQVRTATADAAGVISGAATGRVVHGTGQVRLLPTVLPDSNTVFAASYSGATTRTDAFAPAVAGGAVQLQLASPPRPGSVVVVYSVIDPNGAVRPRRLTDNGSGQLVDETGAALAGSSVDYGSGLLAFNPSVTLSAAQVSRSAYRVSMAWRAPGASGVFPVESVSGQWPTGVANVLQVATFASGGPMQVTYKDNAATDIPVAAESHSVPPLTFDLTPLVSNSVVPGAVLFSLGGKRYYDRNGTLYSDHDPATGSGTASGSINYSSGVATLTRWQGGVAPSADVAALLTQVGTLPVALLHGLAPGRPLRPGTFFVQATRWRDGAVVSASADGNGNIEGSGVHGTVDAFTGAYVVGFGGFVLDSGLTAADKAQPWYSADNVDADGYIWRPEEVVPGSIRISCVVQASLPLDPEIIKVNPVRLPLDGRVPVVRAGDTLVVHDTQPYSMPANLAAGQAVALPRGGLAGVALYDANGLGVPSALYQADLAAGHIVMATPLDLSAYTQPLVALHWIEDMALCLDAQITGELALSRPLAHAYSAANAMVSSALVLGDAQARYEHLFTQGTWLNQWLDALAGSAPASGARYDDGAYPVEVLNRDAIEQRWALVFTNANTFNIVGETRGVIGTGTTAADVAPVNPATGQPYFRVRAAGFGGGWGVGNVIRFNTRAAGAPVWVARTVLSGDAQVQDDRIRLEARWDKD